MTVRADAIGVRGGFACGRCGASDGVCGGRFGDAGRLCFLVAAEAGEEAGLAGGRCGGGGAVAGHLGGLSIGGIGTVDLKSGLSGDQ